MIVELLRPGGAELSRRWLSALLLVPAGDREAVVASVEQRIVSVYAQGSPAKSDAPTEVEVKAVRRRA